jgi:succinate dehydrogenase / fumarate reductase flavoprotein subunit
MEFLQFHPTGMIWPPSVRGILVTEGVRGEGGVLLNKNGERFMFNSIPEPYRNQTSDNEEEGWRYIQGDKNAKRPPELLTRDHVARCIVKEIKEGRGQPAWWSIPRYFWIKKKISNSEAHIKKKLPGMYHMFKNWLTMILPKNHGDRSHYTLYDGRHRVDAETQMSTLPGLFAAGDCGAGLHGANRLGGIHFQIFWCLGKEPVSMQQSLPKKIMRSLLMKDC